MNPNNQNNHATNEGAATVDEQILKKKIAEFSAELQKLQEKYGLVLVPVQNTTQFGTFPDLKVFTNERYAQLMNQAMNNGLATQQKKA